MTLATLQAQHPDWCFNCGSPRGLHGDHDCPWAFNPVIAALKEELVKAGAQSVKDEADICEEIGNRDRFEKALGEMFSVVTGREAEWSSAWGHEDAIQEASEFVGMLESQISEATAALVTLREALEKISGLAWEHQGELKEAAFLAVNIASEALTNTASAAEAAERRIRQDERNGCWSRIEGYIADGVRLECVEDFERLAKDAIFFEPNRERLDE